MKIVFACKSNSCRSQMAEGWAREWIQEKRRKHHHTTSTTPTSDDDDVDVDKEFWNTVMVASVALDSNSVFADVQNSSSCSSSERKRKSVKDKAIQAMASYGVDISKFVPKTLNELLPTLLSSQGNMEEQWSTLEIRTAGDDANINDYDADDHHRRPLDILVVMYACADNVKHHVVKQSNRVMEWNIDAPSAAAKAGEGDEAFRRVSLDIRQQVEELMERLMLLHHSEERIQ